MTLTRDTYTAYIDLLGISQDVRVTSHNVVQRHPMMVI